MKPITPSKLRENIYNILDEVALKGRVITVERNGVLLKIVPSEKKSRLSRLKSLRKTKITRGNSEDLVNIKWDKAWKPKLF